MAAFARVICSSCFLAQVLALQQRGDLHSEEWSSSSARRGVPTILPPRLAGGAPIDPKKAAITVGHLQRFITASLSEGYASIVIMGDSTMSGFVHDFLGIYEGAEDDKVLLHTSNDRPVAVSFTSDGTMVAPGGEWSEPAPQDPVSKLVLTRAQDANTALHSMNCTWAGGVTTYLFTTGPLKGLAIHEWGFIPEYGDSCWKSCMSEAVKTYKASAVLWNIGFHLLNQKFDKPICDRRQNMGKENCGDYKNLVKMGTEHFLDAAPVVVFRTTNNLCDAKHRNFENEFLIKEFDRWQNASMRPALEKECHESCPLMKDMQCYDWLTSSRATELMYWRAINGIAELKIEMPARASQIHVLDAFTSAKECCDTMCDATDDGEHYTRLDRALGNDFAAILSGSVSL